MADKKTIAVIGGGQCTKKEARLAEEVGRELAKRGAVLVCGGLGGVMEAACRGARSRGGVTLGLLPGTDRDEANGWVIVAVPTGLGEARNALVVRAADAVVAIGGGWGTLSEIALAMKTGRTARLADNGERLPFGPILDPPKLIRALKAGALAEKEAIEAELAKYELSAASDGQDLASLDLDLAAIVVHI